MSRDTDYENLCGSHGPEQVKKMPKAVIEFAHGSEKDANKRINIPT